MTPFLLALIFLIAPDTLTGKVVRIADGDTVTILVGGKQVRVRKSPHLRFAIILSSAANDAIRIDTPMRT